MTRYDSVSDPIQRFRKFLGFIYGVVSTETIPYDTYPVAVSKKTMVAGSLIRTVKLNHHSWTIKQILPIGVPHLIYGNTMGAATGPDFFERQSWPNMKWVFQGDYSLASGAGLRYWRPAEYINKPVEQVPGFSMEQFKLPLNSWVKIVKSRLADKQETPEAELHRLFGVVCQGFQERVGIVNDAIGNLRRTNGCYDYATYDIYSTPNRDHRIFDDLMSLRQAYKEHKADGETRGISTEFLAQLDKIFPMLDQPASVEATKMPRQEIGAGSSCVVEYKPGTKIDLAEAKRRLFAGMISNNPLDDLEIRWGERRGPSERARSCQSWDKWSPEFEPGTGLINLTSIFTIKKREPATELYEFVENGVTKRLCIRPLDSDKGTHMLAEVFDVDSENLPVPTGRQVIDPSFSQLRELFGDGTIIHHYKSEVVSFQDGSAKYVEWDDNEPTVRTLQ
jgi:hypothetical protein